MLINSNNDDINFLHSSGNRYKQAMCFFDSRNLSMIFISNRFVCLLIEKFLALRKEREGIGSRGGSRLQLDANCCYLLLLVFLTTCGVL